MKGRVFAVSDSLSLAGPPSSFEDDKQVAQQVDHEIHYSALAERMPMPSSSATRQALAAADKPAVEPFASLALVSRLSLELISDWCSLQLITPHACVRPESTQL